MTNLVPETPLLGIAAYPGSGKTAMLDGLVGILNDRGLKVAMIKHSHHRIRVAQPGQHGRLLHLSPAAQTLVVSHEQTVLVRKRPRPETAASLRELIALLDHETIDLVLLDGYKNASIPKIELIKLPMAHAPLYPDDPDVIAVLCSETPEPTPEVPILPADDMEAVADFLFEWLGLTPPGQTPQ